MFRFVLLTSIFLYCCTITSSQESKIDPDLAARLANGETVNVIVWFKNGVQTALEAAMSLRLGDRIEQKKTIVDALEKNADASQEGVLQALSGRRAEGGFKYFTKYWTSNKIYIKEADAPTIETVAQDPEVSRIQIERIYKLPDSKPEDIGKIDSKRQLGPGGVDPYDPAFFWQHNLSQISGAWDELGGNKGEGVVVGVIDTGVRHTHTDIAGKLLDVYGWFDGVNGSSEPYDLQGHGTGVTGVIVGTESGFAPGAKYMACRGCESEECSTEAIMNCINFMSCPTLPDGSNRDCSKTPHIINFSIGGERDGEPFDEDFRTMDSLGIIPVAGVGNDGPKCSTSVSPANMPFVIAVGGTFVTDANEGGIFEYVSLTSRGPAPDGTIKPDLAAADSWIATPSIADDKLFAVWRGSSFACPQVAAVIALLHVRKMDLTFKEAYDFLTQNTDTEEIRLRKSDMLECDDSFTVIPNNFFGYGRLNALKVLKAQTNAISA